MSVQKLPTPYFLISQRALLKNLERIEWLRHASGTKVVLALKCFSTWGVFEWIKPYLDGTTSSSVYEARLGHETLGGETHAYCVGFTADDVREVDAFADKILFNSCSQLLAHAGSLTRCRSVGLRLNPEVSYARQTLADPARCYSRLGVRKQDLTEGVLSQLQGLMFHFNCENKDLDAFKAHLAHISREFASALQRVLWVSLGGGVLFTADGYPLDQFAALLRSFADKHQVQVYLEPGEAVITKTTDLVVSVVDIVENEKKTAIVDSATEAHWLDTLIFNEPATIREADPNGPHEYIIGASSCLAGDVFCQARFARPLSIGDRLHVMDSAGYTMVKLNWFNGLRMPSIYGERLDGQIECINSFGYDDFKRMLSVRSITGQG